MPFTMANQSGCFASEFLPDQGTSSSLNRLGRKPFTMANQSGCFAGEYLPDQGTSSSLNRLKRKPFTMANKSGCFAGEFLPDQGTGSSMEPCRSPLPTSQDALPVSSFQSREPALH